ncbi:MAG: hypothetical protein HQK76_17195 [Desulfobacterales bacterium]|nr:hypothetical protein [Desulfobacterales bacterium]
MATEKKEFTVFISTHESACDECKAYLGTQAWITLVDGKCICLSCSDLDHLEFLPSGNNALTVSKSYSI